VRLAVSMFLVFIKQAQINSQISPQSAVSDI